MTTLNPNEAPPGYRAVASNGECSCCAFSYGRVCPNTVGAYSCKSHRRSDGTEVIFVKHDEVAKLKEINSELLSALQGVMTWWSGTPAFLEGDDDMPANLFDAARAAIKKAEELS